MRKIFITGASGLVGQQVIRCLSESHEGIQIIAGERKPSKMGDEPEVHDTVHFDFEDATTFEPALEQVDTLFLLRPPQLADVDKYFVPLILAAERKRVRHVVFLSVQGADTNKVIPHHKIEQLIMHSKLSYTFLRPAYFMQNFLTSLHHDLADRHRVFLPAGKAKFTLVDVRDIGRVAATIIQNPEAHVNRAYDLTDNELLTFSDMAAQLSEGLNKPIAYVSPNLLRFFYTKRKDGVATTMILVMIMLHFMPRFSKPPAISDCVQQITGEKPITFRQFVADHRQALLNS